MMIRNPVPERFRRDYTGLKPEDVPVAHAVLARFGEHPCMTGFEYEWFGPYFYFRRQSFKFVAMGVVQHEVVVVVHDYNDAAALPDQSFKTLDAAMDYVAKVFAQ